MQGIGWLSILPPVIAIALAIVSRQVYLALGLYIWLGWTLIHGADRQSPFLEILIHLMFVFLVV